VDEIAPADALSHALGIARRIALGEWTGTRWSPLAEGRDLARLSPYPDLAADAELRRLLAHHDAIPRGAPARAILDAVRLGLTEGLEAGLAFEARQFGLAVASVDGRSGIDRFLARQSWPLPLRRP
jgi:hypothetical protein